MLHACVQRFDVTGNLKNFAKFFGTKPALRGSIITAVAMLKWTREERKEKIIR
jgi:hypothetical protein